MVLHLIVPGLVSPLKSWMRDYDWKPHADALAALLDHGQVESNLLHPYLSVAHLLGWTGLQFPAAIYRALGQGVNPSREGDWCCADPIHLHADAQSAVVLDSSYCELRLDEAQELVLALNSQFNDINWFFQCVSANQWYLRTPTGEAPSGTWLDQAVGKDLRQLPMQNSEQKHWIGRLTEIQMILHQHPINLYRQVRGFPTINSIWCWGKGQDAVLSPCDMNLVMASDDICIGLAKAANIPMLTPSIEHLVSNKTESCLIYLESLLGPAHQGDPQAWSAALECLDREWFSTLNEKLALRTIKKIYLYTENRRWIISPKGLFRRWGRMKSLAQSLAQP